MDSKLKSVMTSLTNVRFEDPSWEQAILPGRYGGLGVRRTEDVALPSYVASLHRCQQHISALLPPSCHAPFVQELAKATEDWQTMAGSSKLPDGDRRHQQRAWDSAIIERRRDSLLSQANQFARARLLSAAAPESGAWLRAIPSRNTGTLLDNETPASLHRFTCGCRCLQPSSLEMRLSGRQLGLSLTNLSVQCWKTPQTYITERRDQEVPAVSQHHPPPPPRAQWHGPW